VALHVTHATAAGAEGAHGALVFIVDLDEDADFVAVLTCCR
jgi:hypothetical protein